MINNYRKSRNAFTLIELMVVVFIIGILSAVAISLLRGRVDASKWSEATSAMGSIRTSARAFCGEKGPAYTYAGTTLVQLGFNPRAGGVAGDLDGKYFSEECYQITFNGYDDYYITCTAADAVGGREYPITPPMMALDETGVFSP
ncbi:MAG: type II secretion system protein [Sedimentisphaerales bacterium]|nr:type II secretion system protein [Sedimentisphaerales bacterium]